MNVNVRILALSAAAFLAACSSNEATTEVGRSLADRTVGGVTYRAETRIMESFPVQLRPLVAVENLSSEQVSISLPDGCEVFLRVYRTADRSGPPVWDESRAAVCTMAIQEISLAPGESVELSGSTIGAAEILGDSLPAGHYYLTAIVRPNGETVELDAGEADLAT